MTNSNLQLLIGESAEPSFGYDGGKKAIELPNKLLHIREWLLREHQQQC